MRRTHRIIATALAIVFVTTACAAGESSDSSKDLDGAVGASAEVSDENDASVEDGGGAIIPEFIGPWADTFAQAYRESESSFVRAILADGEITTAERQEAHNAWIACMAEWGYDASITDDGFTAMLANPDAPVNHSQDPLDPNSPQNICWRENLGQIEALFNALQTNPENLGFYPALHACLVADELIPGSLSARDLEELLRYWHAPSTCAEAEEHPAAQSVTCNDDGTFEIEWLPEYLDDQGWYTPPPVVLPDGTTLDMHADEVISCMNRTGH